MWAVAHMDEIKSQSGNHLESNPEKLQLELMKKYTIKPAVSNR